jgi:hypothetical protein
MKIKPRGNLGENKLYKSVGVSAAANAIAGIFVPVVVCWHDAGIVFKRDNSNSFHKEI